jgi:hypothetical protein
MPTSVAACVCGQLTVSCSGDPAQVSLCHCLACQRRTGSTYGIVAFYPRENVSVAGDATAYTRQSDSGYPVTFYFCPHCGSTVYWEPDRKPEMVGVAVGAFADPTFPAPSQAVYIEHRQDGFRTCQRVSVSSRCGSGEFRYSGRQFEHVIHD